MVQNIKRFRTELNSELLGDPWYHPLLAQRAVQVPKIGTNDGVPPGVTVRTERRRCKAIRIEPYTVELLIPFVEVASRDRIRARRMCAQAVVNPIRDCSDTERSAGQIRVPTCELPTFEDWTEEPIRLKWKLIDAAHAEVVFPAEIREAAIRVCIGRVTNCSAAVQSVRPGTIVDGFGPRV